MAQVNGVERPDADGMTLAELLEKDGVYKKLWNAQSALEHYGKEEGTA